MTNAKKFGFEIGEKAYFANFNNEIKEITIVEHLEAIPNSDGHGYVRDNNGYKRNTMNLFHTWSLDNLQHQIDCDDLIYDEFEGDYF